MANFSNEPLVTLLDDPRSPDAGSWSRAKAFRAHLWCEWYAHGRLLLGFIVAWIVFVWVLPLYANPAWILGFGFLFAGVAGPIYGGSDTMDGSEEFIFALPPSRAQRFLARFAMGGGALLLFTIMDLLALGLDLPQILAKLYVDSGLIHPSASLHSGLLYGLVLSVPAAIFSFSFTFSASTHSRGLVVSSSFAAILVSLGCLWLGLWYEGTVWNLPNGYFACPMLLMIASGVVWLGLKTYRLKECGHHQARPAIPLRWWLWIILFIAGLLLALGVTAAMIKHYGAFFSQA